MTFWGLEIWDLGIWVEVRGLRGPVLEQLRAWADRRSGNGVRAEHRRSGDPGLWARQ